MFNFILIESKIHNQRLRKIEGLAYIGRNREWKNSTDLLTSIRDLRKNTNFDIFNNRWNFTCMDSALSILNNEVLKKIFPVPGYFLDPATHHKVPKPTKPINNNLDKPKKADKCKPSKPNATRFLNYIRLICKFLLPVFSHRWHLRHFDTKNL